MSYSIVAASSASNSNGASTTNVLQFGGANTAGNLLIAQISVYGLDTTTISSITDTFGNTWQAAVAAPTAGLNEKSHIWYAFNCGAHAANFVTVTFSVSTGSRVQLSEFSGGLTTNPIDITNSAQGAVSVPTLSLVGCAANDLIIGCVDANSSQPGAGASYTQSYAHSNSVFGTGEYWLDSGTAGNKTVDFTGSQTLWTECAASFKATPGAAPILMAQACL
jgi:hypothetical protein